MSGMGWPYQSAVEVKQSMAPPALHADIQRLATVLIGFHQEHERCTRKFASLGVAS